MPIKSPKQKGSAGEREAASILMSWAREIGYELKLERNLEQTRSIGSDLTGVPGLEVEIKRVEANGIDDWWTQVCRVSRKSGKRPFLMHRKNRQKWRVRTYAELVITSSSNYHIDWFIVDLDFDQAKKWFQMYLSSVL